MQLPAPRCHGEHSVGVGQIARRRGDDGALGHDKCATALNRKADIFLAHEIEWRLCSCRHRAGRRRGQGRSTLGTEAALIKECADTARE